MSEPIKQTLFTFKTMRTPDLISAENKANFFIQHFDGITGDFLEAVAAMGPQDNRETVLAATAAAFGDIRTKPEITGLSEDHYTLGMYLLKNRTTITVAQATTAVGSLTALSSGTLERIWDNLFYQTITLQSGYAREACLVMLLANHFVANFSSIPSTDAEMQRWANSKVALPSVLFGFETTFGSSETENESSTGDLALSTAMDVAVAKMELDQLETLKAEMTEYKTLFYKTNQALENEAINDYIDDIKTAKAAATTVDYIDQFTEYTFKKFTNYVAPAFTYTKPAEIDMDPIGSYLTPQSLYTMGVNRLTSSKTFQEFDNLLDEKTASLTSLMFEKTAFRQEKIVIDGNLISKCGIEERFRKKFRFLVQLVEKSTNNYLAFLTADVGSSCLKADKVTTVASVPQGNTIVTNETNNVNGILTVDLTKGVPIDLSVESGVSVSVTLEMNNGITFSLTTTSIAPGGKYSGVMTVPDYAASSDIVIPSGFGVKRLGLAEYRKVVQTLCCYVPGEVSHIENLMAREYKERSTRRMRRQEDTLTTSSSSESENMTDTTTTSRFNLQKEISQVLSASNESNQSNSFNASVSGGANFGPVGGVDATIGTDSSTDFSVSSSLEQTNSESVSFAQDVTEKALKRLVSKVSEERVTKIIEEFEEKNQHGFDNRKGAEHISGVYRWVDKIYKNEIHNYGRRLHYEFMIPEPAEFHLIAKANAGNSASNIPLVKPLDPRTNAFGSLPPLKNSSMVTTTNYYQWAAVYGATVLPPPKAHLVFGKTITKPSDGSAWYVPKAVKDEVIIPDGYGIDAVHFSASGAQNDLVPLDDWSYMDISAAGITRRYYENVIHKYWFADADHFPELRYAEKSVAVAANFHGHESGIVSFSIRVTRKNALLEEWKLDTFNAILSAYNDRLNEYKNSLAELEAKKGILMADNPAYYRQIENTVLKKTCISYLTGHSYMGQNYKLGHEVPNNHVNQTEAMDKYAAVSKFFEQAFEWNLMDYSFYPFYWAARERWEQLYNTKNDDALFKAFLSAGMARCILTVRPGFEAAVMYFMETGLIWNGGEVPAIDDDLYVSTLELLKEQEYILEETWETRVPSTLTLIQANTIALDASGLPCYCDTGTPPEEDIIMPVVNPLTGLQVFIEGDTAV